MVRVLAQVEGQTERDFGIQLLAVHLGAKEVYFSPRIIGKPGHKGGVGPWKKAKTELLALLKQDVQGFCTTMFDYYGLPTDWPGREEAARRGLKKAAAVTFVEAAIKQDILSAVGGDFDARRFVPYLQQHEFESLLFSDPAALARVTLGKYHEESFRKILLECGACEDINDDPLNAPSKRILAVSRRYQKRVDGVIAAKRIGLEKMRRSCPHFDQWLSKLEGLVATSQSST